MLTTQFLPAGLVGLGLASMFAAVMSMMASGTNSISAVIMREILPVPRAIAELLSGLSSNVSPENHRCPAGPERHA